MVCQNIGPAVAGSAGPVPPPLHRGDTEKHKPNKWRLIVDLSSPNGASVNDGIDKETCSLSYTSVDAVVEKILELGRGSLLAKLDIKQAYRMIPVHPQDTLLLGME